MFDVSNKIAYNGMMVYGVSRDQDDFPPVPWSVWMDVCSLPGEEKWNPEEGRKLVLSLDQIGRRIEETMREERRDTGEARTGRCGEGVRGGADTSGEGIGLRRQPVSRCRQRYRQGGGEPARPPSHGTVHTTQGKEADIVILVLGTGADQANSRGWASTTPNLLNVAVTRARRRLIVIGDFDAWSRHRYFKGLAEHDEIRRWTPGH
ncbi:AAA domain-containing protein [Streptomyces niveus]|uniref:AAA domain-containing protein n=1 Tax=Streptomyces niveus TaxID=193462 RepID=UPI00364FF996